jgi:hypothetical protein
VTRGISLLVHGLGDIFVAPLKSLNLGGKKSQSRFLNAIEVLTRTSSTGYSVLAEGRTRKIIFCPIFLVAKNEKVSRFIFDGRRLNEHIETPPPVCLPSMDEFLKKLSSDSRPTSKWSFFLMDYRHWFHQLSFPDDMDGPVGVKVRDPRKGMRFFTYRTLPMGFSWSPYLAEAAAWASVLHHEEGAEVLFAPDKNQERMERFVTAIHGGAEVGFACIMYDNVILALRDVEKPTAHKFAQRMMANCKKFQIVVKEASLYTPAAVSGMSATDFVTDSKPCALKRDRAGHPIPHRAASPTILGVVFESTDSVPIKWQHTEKRVQKAKSLKAQPIAWTAREIATRIGLIIWHCIVRRIRLGSVQHIISALKGIAIATKADWDKVLDSPSAEWQQAVEQVLDQIELNEWTHWEMSESYGPRLLCASDASDTIAAGILFDEMGCVRRSWQSECRKTTHIFIKESLALHMTLKIALDEIVAQGSTGASIHIAVDSTSVRRAFERGFSTNSSVNKLINRVWARADAEKVALFFVDIASEFNAADCLTCDSEKRKKEHGHKEGLGSAPPFCGARLSRTFEVLQERLPGREKIKPDVTPISAEKLMLANDDEGEDDCLVQICREFEDPVSDDDHSEVRFAACSR